MAVLHSVGKKFYIPLESGDEAVLQYSRRPDGVLDLYHTEVPASQRGRGLGGVLAEAALSYAKEEGLKVILTCTYLQHYVTKHEEHIDIVLK